LGFEKSVGEEGRKRTDLLQKKGNHWENLKSKAVWGINQSEKRPSDLVFGSKEEGVGEQTADLGRFAYSSLWADS